jgi:3-phenylpropionate/cinnamic acid dioxygenase small subunit
MAAPPSDQQLIDFVLREARLLDQQRLEEDKLLLKIRIDRLKGKTTYSQSPKSRCHHVLQTPQVDERNDLERHYVTWTPMHYVESRAEEQTLYAAWATHHLTVIDGALKIRLKRVDLVNCDAALGSIQLFL